MKTLFKLTMLVLVLNASPIFAQKNNAVKTVMYECNFDCPSCEEKVMKNIAYEKGVKSVKVYYGENQVEVSYKSTKNSDEGLKQALIDLGYETTALGNVERFEVKGNCGMCKDKIEAATKSVDGVNAAHWDTESHILTVAYDAGNTNLETIHKAIADIGYDTDKVKASDEDYDNLHHCCKYDR